MDASKILVIDFVNGVGQRFPVALQARGFNNDGFRNLLDEELADKVWQDWIAGIADDEIANLAWMFIACVPDKMIQIEALQPMPSSSFLMPVKFVAKP